VSFIVILSFFIAAIVGEEKRMYPGAIILAGGQSRRMGSDKALLRLTANDPTFIELVMSAARSVVDKIVISTNNPERYAWLGIQMVADRVPGEGPLAGLEAGLSAMEVTHSLLLGCDMPFLVPDVLRALLSAADDFDAVVPVHSDGHLEPLCALYSMACLPVIREQLAASRNKMQSWLTQVRVRMLAMEELRQYDPDLRSFRNFNTQDELQEAIIEKSL
jgi:molybdenum cofactor guanylyltransferase